MVSPCSRAPGRPHFGASAAPGVLQSPAPLDPLRASRAIYVAALPRFPFPVSMQSKRNLPHPKRLPRSGLVYEISRPGRVQPSRRHGPHSLLAAESIFFTGERRLYLGGTWRHRYYLYQASTTLSICLRTNDNQTRPNVHMNSMGPRARNKPSDIGQVTIRSLSR